MRKEKSFPWLWDLWCIISVVGIWPRYIEPKWISTTKLQLQIDALPAELNKFKILQFNDLHINNHTSPQFLKKLTQKIKLLEPDLIVFVGDFICYSNLTSENTLLEFLNTCSAPYGCFAVLGNHDYQQFVSINKNGEYDTEVNMTNGNTFSRAFTRLFSNISVKGKSTERALKTPQHTSLIQLLKKSPFKLLHNESETIKVKNSFLNICGLGEYMLKKCIPEEAFKYYKEEYPGIILSHNPDSISILKDYPGELILSGHTHGGQINLPWFWRKFTLLENMDNTKGLKKVGPKWLYINRGIGSVLPFRWFAPPEITLITLEQSNATEKQKQSERGLSHSKRFAQQTLKMLKRLFSRSVWSAKVLFRFVTWQKEVQ